ncbi:MAG: CPBP family intramembrane metalloprotease [Firmicutes bacterium]|nr:CPBP family intramembrane metalloprotease [Bacillota bacterium]
MNKVKDYPNFWQSLYLIIVLTLQQIILFILCGLIGMKFNYHFERNLFVIGLINLVTFGAALYKGLKMNYWNYSKVFPMRLPRIRMFPIAIIIFVGVSLCCVYLNNFFDNLFNIPKDMFNIYNIQYDLFGVIFTLLVIAPITEELFFRGVILNGFLSRYGISKSIILSGILFGVFHLNPSIIPGAIIGGIIFAWIAIKENSLVLPIIGHIVYNSITIINKYNKVEIKKLMFVSSIKEEYLLLSGIIMLLIGLTIFYKNYMYNKK